MPGVLPVIVEVGTRRSFACAVDYPGWARAGRTPEAAIEALLATRERYARIAERAGVELPQFDGVEVVETLTGNATTDFGAPGQVAAIEHAPCSPESSARLAALVAACAAVFDEIAAAAPEQLRKGPRGGGRDTSKVVEHVRDADAGYRRKRDWPEAYTARRAAWHLTDHAWEIEDRS